MLWFSGQANHHEGGLSGYFFLVSHHEIVSPHPCIQINGLENYHNARQHVVLVPGDAMARGRGPTKPNTIKHTVPRKRRKEDVGLETCDCRSLAGVLLIMGTYMSVSMGEEKVRSSN
jgi:hypothetical protein